VNIFAPIHFKNENKSEILFLYTFPAGFTQFAQESGGRTAWHKQHFLQ
jgi:hypothetical protein